MIKNKSFTTKKTAAKNNNSDFSFILKCACIQATVFILFCFISFTAGIKVTDFKWITPAALIIGSSASGFISGKFKRKKGYIYGVLFSLPFNLILLVISLFVNSFSVDYMLPVCLLGSVISSSLGGMLSVNIKKKVKIKR